MNTNIGLNKKDYVGLTLQKAQEKAKQENFGCRVVKENGKPKIITQELNPNRINFDIEDNIVTKAEIY